MALKAFDVFGEIALKGAKQVQSDLKSSAAAAKEAGGAKGLGGLNLSAAGVAATLAAMGVAAIKFGIDAANAAIKSEVSTAKLKTVVNNTGGSYDLWKGKISEVITEQKALSAFSGGELKSAITTLIRMTGSAGKGMDLLGTSTNLARATGMDLETSAKLIGKVYNGNTAILKRYGIVVKDGATATEALDAIQKSTAGAAEAYGRTIQGSNDRIANSFATIKTNAGASFVQTYGGTFNLLAKTSEMAASGTFTWQKYEEARRQAVVESFIAQTKVKTLEKAQQREEFAMLSKQEQAIVAVTLSKQKQNDAILANTNATMANTQAAEDALNAEYEAEDASIADARSHFRLTDAKKALTAAIKEHGKKSREAKEAALDYRDAVLAAKRADDKVAADSGPAKNAIGALARAWEKAATAAGQYASKARTANAIKNPGKNTGGYIKHSGGGIAETGMYSLQAGEYVLDRYAVQKLNANPPVASSPAVNLFVDLGDGMRRVSTQQTQSGAYRAALAGR